jgi:hypothetical protein
MSKGIGSFQIKETIKWPQGKHPTQFRNKIKKHKDKILNGRILAIDPASGSTSHPGWALFERGELIGTGSVQLDSKLPIQGRLNALFKLVSEGIGQPPPDVLIMEEIRGSMAHAFLFWACGVIAAACGKSELIEEPVSFWSAVVPNGYVKSDETDAVYIGLTAILIAKEYQDDK